MENQKRQTQEQVAEAQDVTKWHVGDVVCTCIIMGFAGLYATISVMP